VARNLKGGPFEFELGSIEPFGGNKHKPSAYAVVPKNNVHELKDFMAIHRNEVARAAHARPDSRTPRPHITVARPRRRATYEQRNILHHWALRQKTEDVVLPLEKLALYTWSDERDERLFKIVETTFLHPAD
jgi:2'-5' RNA ligase